MATKEEQTFGEQAPPTRRTHEPLGHRAARGFGWLFGQHIADRVLFAAQGIVLAWLLTREHYDLIALTYTVTSFASLLQQAGMGQILVQRQRRFARWATPVFWLGLTSGALMGGLVAAASPMVAHFYQRDELIGLLLVCAVTMPLSSLAIVPDARLRSELRFGAIALVALVHAIGTVTLSIVLAWRGFGAYSFVLPGPIMLCVTLAVQWRLAKTRIGLSPQLGRWRYLVTDSAMLLVGQTAMMATYQGGQLVLGRMHRSQPFAGTYYFALNFSDQATRLLVQNLSSVLFPTLSRLRGEVQRQTQAFLHASRVLLVIGVPGCLLQSLLAGPVIRLCFPKRWEPAVIAFAVLSISMIGRLVYGPSESMLLAQRRVKTFMITAVTYAIAYLIAVIAGATSAHPVEGVAIAVTGCILILTPIMLRLAINPAGGGWSDVRRAYQAPVLSGLAAALPCAAIMYWLLPNTVLGDLAALAVLPLVFGAIYIAVIRSVSPSDWQEASTRLRTFVLQAVGFVGRRVARRVKPSPQS